MLEYFKLTILCENRVINPRLIAEQGLSIFVETSSGNVLFDTGQTDTFIKNAEHLGIDLNTVKKVVLSHGHYDHTGGLPALIKKRGATEIICHPALIHKKYRVFPGGRLEIGVPWEKSTLIREGADFHFYTHPHQILPDIWISGEIPRHNSYEQIDETYQQRVLESYIQDQLHDELFLALNTRSGLVVLQGCGHAGAVNSLKHAMRITHINHIHALIGGMHLHNADEERIDAIIENISRLNPDFIVPLHCTGFTALHKLFNVFKDRVKLLNVGDRFEAEQN
ncbi:MAG: MBL fold metallo-hydrolase [Calditrichaeota bacterium]|nr:MBL fold metallo-hydrolase [Calditrichota bacterium]